jgi:glycosyltransferase involved in cell wall biosynthesis
MLNLGCGFLDMGHRVDLVLAEAQGPYLSEVPAGITVVDLGSPRVIMAMPGLIRYLRRRRPSRLYAAMDHTNLVALWARLLAAVPVKVIVSIRDRITESAMMERSLRHRMIVPLARLFYRQAAGIIAVSDGAADDAACVMRLPRDRIIVIPNPVITADLPERAASSVDHAWLKPGEPPLILAAGRLVPQKDFATLLRAFALVRQRRSARLLILGEGNERPALEALSRELAVAEHVQMPGFAANPFAYMARAAVFALSSVREGSPNVVVQALACGCPVVSTDCPSGPREILEGMPQGRLVPVGDPSAMADALLSLLQAPRLPAPELDRFQYLSAARQYLAVGKA